METASVNKLFEGILVKSRSQRKRWSQRGAVNKTEDNRACLYADGTHLTQKEKLIM